MCDAYFTHRTVDGTTFCIHKGFNLIAELSISLIVEWIDVRAEREIRFGCSDAEISVSRHEEMLTEAGCTY